MAVIFALYALCILVIFNSLTYKFCAKQEMNQERQFRVYRMINISITILLISSYLEALYVY